MRAKTILVLSSLVLLVNTGKAQENNWTSHPDTVIWNTYNLKTISVEQLRAKAGDKRILLYYYEHLNIHANKFNEHVMSNPELVKFITSNFYPICLDLDIDNLVTGGNAGRSKVYRKFLEDQTYYIKVTPALSVYSTKNVLRGSKSFLNADESTLEPVRAFLEKRLK